MHNQDGVDVEAVPVKLDANIAALRSPGGAELVEEIGAFQGSLGAEAHDILAMRYRQTDPLPESIPCAVPVRRRVSGQRAPRVLSFLPLKAREAIVQCDLS